MAAPRVVVILGDDIALGQGCAPGDSYVELVERVLSHHGVELHNWSRQELSAVAVASEMQDELQAQMRGLISQAFEVVVVVALGNQDRFLQMAEVYDSYLEATVRMFQNENAKVIVLQTVPVDDTEHAIAKGTGARYLPAPKSAVEQFGMDHTLLPFVPHPHVHRDIAKLMLQALEQELDVPLSDSHAASSEPKARRTKHRSGAGSPIDGVWRSQENPGFSVMISGDAITSPEGEAIARITRTAPDTYATDLGDAQLVDERLVWSDGDIWVRVDGHGHQVQIQNPPQRKKKADLKALKKAWDAAEEAVNRTRVEEGKRELHEERELLQQERHRLEQRRRKYEEGRQHQHEETEKLSAMRVG